MLTGASESIVVRIFGPELEGLRQAAAEVKQALTGIEGLVDLHEEPQKDIPQVQITVDLAKAGRYGLKPGDVRRAAAIIFAGQEVSDIHRDDKVYDVMVWSTPETRHSLNSVHELLLDTPDGGHVRLGDVADVRIGPTPNIIKRENASRRIDVHANVRGRDLGSVVQDVEERLKQVQLSAWLPRATAGRGRGAAGRPTGPAARREWSPRSGFFCSCRPPSAAGAWLPWPSWPCRRRWWAACSRPMLGDRIISLGSLVGFLTVLGIAARNGILLINHYQHLERHEGEAFGPGLILRGARERLSPILMTTLATGLALVPLAITGDIPGHEIEHPMAVVILGGLVTSTLLNLLLVPVLYLRMGPSPEPALNSELVAVREAGRTRWGWQSQP